MYPTAIVGIVLVFAAAQYARQPDRRRLELVIGLEALTLFVSCLGFVTGMIKSTVASGELADPVGTVIVGFGESLVNVGFGLAILTVASIGLAIGLYRGNRSSTTGALLDPLT